MSLPRKTQPIDRLPITVNFSDSIGLVHEQVHWTPKGVVILTKWHFALGAEVEFAFDHRGERHCCTGIVVGCHPLREPAGFYETVLFFADTPCEKLYKAACDCRLARDRDEHLARERVARDGHSSRANGSSHRRRI